MGVEGRFPGYFDIKGVLHTARKKQPEISQEEYIRGVSPYNINEGIKVKPSAHIDLIEPRDDLSNVSVKAIESGDFDRPKLVGRLESELHVF